MARWKPATVTKQANGAQYLVAFTDKELMDVFAKTNDKYSFAYRVEGTWLLNVLPDGHGIAFNLGSDNGVEWPVEGIAAYKAAQRR